MMAHVSVPQFHFFPVLEKLPFIGVGAGVAFTLRMLYESKWRARNVMPAANKGVWNKHSLASLQQAWACSPNQL